LIRGQERIKGGNYKATGGEGIVNARKKKMKNRETVRGEECTSKDSTVLFGGKWYNKNAVSRKHNATRLDQRESTDKRRSQKNSR